jgi:hypothetical protein
LRGGEPSGELSLKVEQSPSERLRARAKQVHHVQRRRVPAYRWTLRSSTRGALILVVCVAFCWAISGLVQTPEADPDGSWFSDERDSHDHAP